MKLAPQLRVRQIKADSNTARAVVFIESCNEGQFLFLGHKKSVKMIDN